MGPLRAWRGNRQALAPGAWEAGKVYVDEQEFVIPEQVKTDRIQFTTGIWRGNDRLKIKGPGGDSQNRGIVVNIPTGAPRARINTRVPQLVVERLAKGTVLKIDGKLDDEAWRTAPSTGPFVDVSNGRPNPSFPVQGSAKVLWDESAVYFGFDVKDSDLVAGFPEKAKDPKLWTQDTVELMIDPVGDGDNRDYYEIQVNPQNLVFDSHFDSYNAPKKDPDGPFGHQDWSAKLTSAVAVRGTLDKAGDKDEGYTVEIKIPWTSFHKAGKKAPKVGDVWRVNLYAMQKNSGVSWSPILGQGNFHKASRFGKIIWSEKGWVSPDALPPPVRVSGPSRGEKAAPALGRKQPGGQLKLAPHQLRPRVLPSRKKTGAK